MFLPDDLANATGLTADELRLELAVWLFLQERLSLGQSARLAGLAPADFMDVVGARDVPLHYGVNELEQDARTLRELFRD